MILVTDGVLYKVISISKIAAAATAAAKTMAMVLSALMSHNINKFLLCCGVTFTPKLTLLRK